MVTGKILSPHAAISPHMELTKMLLWLFLELVGLKSGTIMAFILSPKKSKKATANASYFLKKKLKQTNNSDCMQGSSCEIPTVMPTFSMFEESMKLLSILCGVSGGQRSKMAAHKDGELITLHEYNIAAQFQQQHLCFWGWWIQWSYVFPMLCDANAEIKIP